MQTINLMISDLLSVAINKPNVTFKILTVFWLETYFRVHLRLNTRFKVAKDQTRSKFVHFLHCLLGYSKYQRSFQNKSESQWGYCLDEIVVMYVLQKHVNIIL